MRARWTKQSRCCSRVPTRNCSRLSTFLRPSGSGERALTYPSCTCPPRVRVSSAKCSEAVRTPTEWYFTSWAERHCGSPCSLHRPYVDTTPVVRLPASCPTPDHALVISGRFHGCISFCHCYLTTERFEMCSCIDVALWACGPAHCKHQTSCRVALFHRSVFLFLLPVLQHCPVCRPPPLLPRTRSNRYPMRKCQVWPPGRL